MQQKHRRKYARPQIVVNFFRIFLNFVSKKLGLPEVYVDPGRFRKLREAQSNHFHLFSSKLVSMVTSSDPKP